MHTLIKLLLLLPLVCFYFIPYNSYGHSLFRNGDLSSLIIFFPALLVVESAFYCFPFDAPLEKLLKIQGILMMVLIPISMISKILSGLNFGFGGGAADVTFVFWAIPVYEFLFAWWSIHLSKTTELNFIDRILFSACT